MLLYMALYATFEYNEDIKVARNMYSVVKFHIKENRYPKLFEYCAEMSAKSKRLRNEIGRAHV